MGRLLLWIRAPGALVSSFVLATSVASAQSLVDGTLLDVVGTSPETSLYGTVIADDGSVFIGNNSNATTGPPLQVFDPTLYFGTPIPLGSLGPPLGDGDGLTIAGGDVLVPDVPAGVWRVPTNGAAATIELPGVAIGFNGSPLAYRESDGHVFLGRGNLQPFELLEYDNTGTLIATHVTNDEVQLIAIDQATDTLFYTPYTVGPTNVYEFQTGPDPDLVRGVVSGPIAGLAYDAASVSLLTGTGTAVLPGIPGLVEQLDLGTGFAQPLAFGFPDCRGVAFDVANNYLYVLSVDGTGSTLYRATLTNTPDVWVGLDGAVAGVAGMPMLVGGGALLPSQFLVLTLTNAAPNSTAFFVYGFLNLSAPFKGGVLVPDPTPPGAVISLVTDSSGRVVLPAIWPDGVPSGFSIYCQYWIPDPAAVQGFAASNGLSGTVP